MWYAFISLESEIKRLPGANHLARLAKQINLGTTRGSLSKSKVESSKENHLRSGSGPYTCTCAYTYA